MHEWSVAQSILEVIEQQLGGKQRLASVDLRLGPLSGVNADALQFCFSEVAQQQGFGPTALCIEAVPAELRCRSCGATYTTEDFFAACPQCGSPDRTILSGGECQVQSVEVPDA